LISLSEFRQNEAVVQFLNSGLILSIPFSFWLCLNRVTQSGNSTTERMIGRYESQEFHEEVWGHQGIRHIDKDRIKTCRNSELGGKGVSKGDFSNQIAAFHATLTTTTTGTV
jgi:hypothetical protein